MLTISSRKIERLVARQSLWRINEIRNVECLEIEPRFQPMNLSQLAYHEFFAHLISVIIIVAEQNDANTRRFDALLSANARKQISQSVDKKFCVCRWI